MRLNMIKLSNGKGIAFKNTERIDEYDIYIETLGRIKNLPEANRIEDIVGPSEDVSIWEVDGNEVRLVLDIDYGVKILADVETTVDFLINALGT